MEAIRVKDKEWKLAGVHYVRTEAMCNGFGVSLEMEFGEDKAGDEYILVLDGIHPVSTCRLHSIKGRYIHKHKFPECNTFFFQSPRPFLNSISLYFVVIISVEYVFIIN